MSSKNLFYTIILFGLLWSCGKDDAPTPAVIKNNAPTISDQSFTVSEDITDEKSIGNVKATDVDGDKLTFTIITNDNNLFEISELGVLSLASGKSLDYETAVEHVIKVSVSDGTDQKEANITIDVSNVVETLAEDPSSFVTLWSIPENDFEIMIGTNPDYEYNYTVDWGDGTVEELTMQNPAHVYNSVGEYKVAIQGVFPAIKMGHSDLFSEEGFKILTSLVGLEQWGTNTWESFNSGFANCINMEYHATDLPNLQNVEDMSQMFASIAYGELEDFGKPSVFNADLSGWDVSNVTNMSGMFVRAELFTSDLSGWNVSNVTDMSGLFSGASSFNADLSGWDVSNVTDMSGLFSSASSFNADLSGWDVGNVTNMSSLFSGTSSFNADISGWDVGKVTNMNGMFSHTTFNGDLSGWDVSNVTDMGGMFYYNELFNGDISVWDVSNVTNMWGMFSGTQSFNTDIGNWNISSVTNISFMFSNASAFNKDISGWDVSNISDMFAMFAEAVKFDQNLGSWNIENITIMHTMFSNSGMSKENYGATIVGWANLENVPTNITLGAENIQYCADSEAATARETLINDFGWAFNGDSPVNCD